MYHVTLTICVLFEFAFYKIAAKFFLQQSMKEI